MKSGLPTKFLPSVASAIIIAATVGNNMTMLLATGEDEIVGNGLPDCGVNGDSEGWYKSCGKEFGVEFDGSDALYCHSKSDCEIMSGSSHSSSQIVLVPKDDWAPLDLEEEAEEQEEEARLDEGGEKPDETDESDAETTTASSSLEVVPETNIVAVVTPDYSSSPTVKIASAILLPVTIAAIATLA